jgi:uncharacterized protein (TIGR04222 family)
MGEHGRYEIAFLTGGAVRVVQTALVALHEGDHVRVARGTHRVQAVNREADDPVQAALLARVPGTGITTPSPATSRTPSTVPDGTVPG